MPACQPIRRHTKMPESRVDRRELRTSLARELIFPQVGMHKLIVHIIFLLFALGANAQVLVVLPEAEEPKMPHFNEKFIARNKIAAIHGEIMVKRDNVPMVTQKEKYLYRFDEQGRITYRNSSFGQPGTGRDTASTIFDYDPNGLLQQKLRNDLNGHFAYKIERDAKGVPIRETYTRIENLNSDRYKLVPGAVTEISDEFYRYEQVNDTMQKKIFINDLQLPYREQLFIKNKLGYLTAIEDRYLVSNRRSRIRFSYDDKGRMIERIDQPDILKEKRTKRVWRYDAAGNVTEGELWHDDVQIDREEYLYEEGTMMLKARLTKDLATNTINVVRFRTEQR